MTRSRALAFEWAFRLIYAIVLVKLSSNLFAHEHFGWLLFTAVGLPCFVMVGWGRLSKLEYLTLAAAFGLLMLGGVLPSRTLAIALLGAGLGGLFGANCGAIYRHFVRNVPSDPPSGGAVWFYVVGAGFGVWILVGW
jgi:hypothetical protein